MRFGLLCLAFASAAVGAGFSKMVGGSYSFNADGGPAYVVCGVAFKADGGRRRLEEPCVECKDSKLSARSCEAEWKLANDL